MDKPEKHKDKRVENRSLNFQNQIKEALKGKVKVERVPDPSGRTNAMDRFK